MTRANLHICSFAFNSTDERDALFQELKPLGATLTEFVPIESKDPRWFEQACRSVKKCDITVFSGHFGGVFFGEGSSITLSMAELLQAKKDGYCSSVLTESKTVMLMGCNTMASKKKDHRNIHEYLNVLINDGFPLDLAERVAATRYLNYGESNEEIMNSIFSKADIVLGFESTGPLGRYAGPQVRTAIRKSSKDKKMSHGFDVKEFKKAFKGTSLRVSTPKLSNSVDWKENALTFDASKAEVAWRNILSQENRKKYIDFIVRNQKNMYLKHLIRYDLELQDSLKGIVKEKLKISKGLSSIQLEMINFLRTHRLVTKYEYDDFFEDIVSSVMRDEIDYVRAAQICKIYKSHSSEMKDLEERGIIADVTGLYSNYINSCKDLKSQKLKPVMSTLSSCLATKSKSDWSCLTSNQAQLDVNSCLIAASRNTDVENADDMLWYCYSKMRVRAQLNRAQCLQLTDNFKILGNKLKMNWNCLNRIKY
ncbi:hypothetical protein M900_2281 [Bacteriovorax sp. Seq25_V]|nr:hypothetical protein M900_2281 [Bacteriovorax sp. Seq25_V]